MHAPTCIEHASNAHSKSIAHTHAHLLHGFHFHSPINDLLHFEEEPPVYSRQAVKLINAVLALLQRSSNKPDTLVCWFTQVLQEYTELYRVILDYTDKVYKVVNH